jgi:hypothetical protein
LISGLVAAFGASSIGIAIFFACNSQWHVRNRSQFLKLITRKYMKNIPSSWIGDYRTIGCIFALPASAPCSTVSRNHKCTPCSTPLLHISSRCSYKESRKRFKFHIDFVRANFPTAGASMELLQNKVNDHKNPLVEDTSMIKWV